MFGEHYFSYTDLYENHITMNKTYVHKTRLKGKQFTSFQIFGSLLK